MARKTGLQWLAEQVLPGFLAGIAGRWLILKLFNLLTEKGIIKPGQAKWLMKPIKDVTPVAAAASFQEAFPELRNFSQERYASWDEHDVLAKVVGLASMSWVELPSDEQIEQAIAGSLTGFLPLSDPLTEFLGTKGLIIAGTDSGPTRKPEPKSYPRHISLPGKSVWDGMFKDYRDEILRLGKGDNLREWAAAIIIYQRLAKSKNVAPYRGHKGLLLDESKKAQKLPLTLEKARNKGTRELLKVVKILGGQSQDPKYDHPSFQRGTYRFAFYLPIPLKGKSNKYKAELKKKLVKAGFSSDRRIEKKGDGFSLVLDPSTREEWNLFLQIPVAEHEARLISGKKDRQQILKRLNRLGRKWYKENKFPPIGSS